MSLFRLFSKAGLSLFFDRIEVDGADRIPRDQPLLVVANHTNGLVDGLLLTVATTRPVTLTAKSALRKNPLLAFVVWLAGAVPLYRRQDDASEVGKNVDSFEEIRKRLMQNAAIGIFPEGVSHSDASLRQFKTGAARIALDFAERGGRGLQIVPVGLHYDAKQRFRSPVWVRFGKPIDFDSWRAAAGAMEAPPSGGAPADGRVVSNTGRDAMHALTNEIEQRIRELTTNFGRMREALWLRWTASLLATRASDPLPLDAEPRRFADRARLLGALRVDYERVDRDRVATLFREMRGYRRELRRLGIEPEEVWLSMNPARAAFFVLRELELILAGSAIFVAGVIQHGLAFLADRALTKRLSVDLDHWASNAIFYGLAIFPLIWIAGIALAATLGSRWWALAYAALIPYTLLYTVLYWQRVAGAVRRARTFLTFLFHRGLQRDLQQRGRLILDEIDESRGTRL